MENTTDKHMHFHPIQSIQTTSCGQHRRVIDFLHNALAFYVQEGGCQCLVFQLIPGSGFHVQVKDNAPVIFHQHHLPTCPFQCHNCLSLGNKGLNSCTIPVPIQQL